uniref:Transmembrane protein n=1 Tax=Solanum lycopersicum TaxID=4081 RepID=A0A3Q7FCK3_SOLLC
MARVIIQYITIFFFLHLLLVSLVMHATEARPFIMVQNSEKHFNVVVKNSGPSPGIGHHDYGDLEKPIVIGHNSSGPSPNEGRHK